MTQEQTGLAQQALNKAAEVGLTSQVDAVENVAVDVRTDPLKLAQGEVESVAVAGDGVVILQDLRLEELNLQTGNVAIDLMSAVFGKVELTQPTTAKVRVVLTEADLNRALKSEYIRDRMGSLDIAVSGQVLRIDLQTAECRLPSDNEIGFTADFLLHAASKSYPVSLFLELYISNDGEYISLKKSKFDDEKHLPIELTAALVTMLSELLNGRYFRQKDLTVRIDKLTVEVGKIILQVIAHVEKFPLT